MDTINLLGQIFEVCIIPLLGLLTAYLVKYINSKTSELSENVSNETTQKYIKLLNDTITSCVIATNQTYVDSLKKQNKFDATAQKAAFSMTLNAVLAVLTEDAKKYLSEAYGDLNTYITNQIEATINQNKIDLTTSAIAATTTSAE